MTEQLSLQLTAEEAIQRIAADIQAYPRRPTKLEEHLRLYSGVLDPEEIKALWTERYAATEWPLKRRKFADDPAPVFILTATQLAAEPKPEAEPQREPEREPEVEEESVVEDEANQANNIRRKLWRLDSALSKLGPEWGEEVGALLWRISKGQRDAGCQVWVKWLGEDARARWQQGFGPAGSAERVYRAAQLAGWRYPIAQNLNRLEKVAEHTEAALVRADAEIYQKGSCLVRPVKIKVQATKHRTTIIAMLEKVNSHYFKAALTETIDFFKWKKNDQREGIAPHSDVVNAVLKRFGKWKFPEVTGIVTAQTLRPDGSVLAREGLDKATGLLVMGPLPAMQPIPTQLTRKDAEEAVAILDRELLSEFPFCDDASKSAALSGLITPNTRPALTCAPLHASTAPVSGTGKSFLWDTCAAIVIGDIMPIIATGGSTEELEKRLDTKMMNGETIFSIDNVTMPLGGDTLCQAIERPSVSARTLGKSEMREHRNNWSLFACGNNLRLRDDVTRRTLLVRMDAGIEQPLQRRFKANPMVRVLANRGRYIRAALIVVLAYRAAGMPGRLPSIGDPFAEWSDNVRSALVWLGYADPVETMEAVRERDPSRQARMALLQAMLNAYGSDRRTAAEMISDAKSGSIGKSGQNLLDRPSRSQAAVDLNAAIVDYTNNKFDAKYLGSKLRTDVGSITAGLRLCCEQNLHTKINNWWVEKA